MSPQAPRPPRTTHGATLARPAQTKKARVVAALCKLCAPVLVCAASFAAPFAATATTPLVTVQQPAQTPAAPAPTPYVRPRTVGPRSDASKSAAPAETPQEPKSTTTTTGNAPESKETTADGNAPEEVGEDEVVRVDSNLVVIPASVTDGGGRAVTDLRIEDFELRVDGQVQTISDLSRAEMPVFITMLFDNSSSLSAAREFEKQAAVRFFRSIVRPVDRAAVYAISTTPTLAQTLTNDVNRLVGTIERFGKPDGATALFDAIAQAADYMRPVAGRKVLVLVSDGTDTVSDVAFEEAITRALRAECQVYVVQTRQVEEPNLRDLISEQRMLKLSEQTGGAVFIPQSIEDLDAAFAQIALDLSQQYLLSYYPQQGRKDNYFRFINLSVKTRPNLRVRARKGFYPHALGLNAPPPDAPATAPAPAAAVPRPAAAKGPAGGANTSRGRASGANSSGDTTRSAKTKPGQRTDAPGRKTGPAGPDEEEAALREPAPAPEPSTTLTIKVMNGVPRTPETAYVPVAQPSPTPFPTPAPATQFATPAPTPQPEPTPSTMTAPVTPPPPSATASATPPASSPKTEPAPEVEDASPSRPAATAERRTISGGVLNAKALSLPRPSYPPAAKSAGVYGIVVVAVTLDERGKVAEASVVSGPALLHGAAMTAARQARFSPTVLSGAPVRVTGTISYNFVRP